MKEHETEKNPPLERAGKATQSRRKKGLVMTGKPTYSELADRVKELEGEVASHRSSDQARITNEERLALILDRLPLLVAYVDSEQVYGYVNSEYERWFNLPRDQIIGRKVRDVLGEAGYETVRGHIETTLSGTAVTYEGVLPMKAGGSRRFCARYAPCVDPNGKVQGFSAVVEDITDTREAEAALRAEQAILREYLDIAEVMIVVLNPDQTVALINRKGLEILRRSGREVLGRKWFDAFVPDRIRESVVSEFKRLMAGEVTPRGFFENPILTGDGEERIILWHNTVLRNKSGQITGTLSSGQDVTDTRWTAEALKWDQRVDSALSKLYEPLTRRGSTLLDVTRYILQSGKTLTDSAHGYVSIIEPETGDNVSLTLTEMLQDQCHVEEEEQTIRFPRGHDGKYPGLWGQSLNTKKPFFTNTPGAHEASRGVPAGHVPLERFLSVPVMLEEELVGQIALANSSHDYTKRDLQAVCRIGDYLALAIQRMRADEALKQAHDHLELRVRDRTEELLRAQRTLESEILQRRKIEKALREGNELLDRIFSNTHLAIAYLDRDFNFIRVNRAYAAHDAKDPDYFRGKNHFQLFPDEENERIFRQVRDTGVAYTAIAKPFEYAYVPERGKTYWDWSLIPVRSEQGDVEGFVLGLVNVTERMISEALVRESEEKYSTLVENSLIGIYIAQDGTILFANRQHAAMHGYTQQELIGMASWKLVHPDSREFFRGLVRDRNLGKDVPSEYEIKGITKDGRAISTLRKVSTVEFLGTKASLVNVMDITRVKEAEHLMRMQDKMASLGRIATGIAHELRNPLSGMNIHLSNLDRIRARIDLPDLEAAEQLNVIVENLKTASGKIETVVKRVMDFSKPSSHQLVQGDINRPLKAALELCAVTLRKLEISVEHHLAADLPKCLVNENMMEEVFVNLISNAAQSLETIDGPRRLSVSTSHRDGEIRVQIEDSGPGIPQDIRERIFEPFFTGRKDGLGIGLSICYRIVQDHQGMMIVGTSRWGGALFEIVIPLREWRKV